MVRIPLRTAADIGAVIRDRRHAQRLDQEELARKVGVRRLWISQVEHGKPGASLGLILRTLGALGLRLSADADDAAASTDAQPVVTPDINAIVANARRPNRP